MAESTSGQTSDVSALVLGGLLLHFRARLHMFGGVLRKKPTGLLSPVHVLLDLNSGRWVTKYELEAPFRL